MNGDLPKIHVGPSTLSNFEDAIQLEWIVTNGLGGYASSTTLGINTRKYHGLLVAALNPPVDRQVVLTKLDEEVQIESKKYNLGSNEFKSGVQPRGCQFLSSFLLGPLPTYRYTIPGFQLQKRIFMPHGKNATIVMYDVSNSNKNGVLLRISPLVNSRHFYSVTTRENSTGGFIQTPLENGILVKPSNQSSALILSSSVGQHFAEGEWIREIFFRTDSSRGESCFDDSFQPGLFELGVAPKEKKSFCIVAAGGRNEEEACNILSSIGKELHHADLLLDQELQRQRGLLMTFQEWHADVQVEDWLKWLILAADSFIVNRRSTKRKSVIAGYHWFEDWGRDSMISLPGLALVTGRFKIAEDILLTFKQYCCKGLVPNRFPDAAGDRPIYNTVDASLWYFHAVLQYLKYTGDFSFVRAQLWGTLQSIVEHHIRGTSYDIRTDEDGLITHGPQLTWMDATVGDKPVTPRMGKAVEIQALWYNALKIMALLATRFEQKEDSKKYEVMAEKARESFAEKFWNPQRRCLFDVVYKEHGDETLRPNQVIAIALDFSMLDPARARETVETVWRELWGTYGLKTLAEDDSSYLGTYQGDWAHRNRAYHNGTVWAWLLGPFTTSFLKVNGYEERWRNFAFQNFLEPLFTKQVLKAGLGVISEIFNGDSPYIPQGCISQAWSVAEPLRAFVEDVMLKRPLYEREILGRIGYSC